MANRIRLGVILLLLLGVTAACGAPAKQPALDGTNWNLTAWAEPEPIPAGVAITAEFADGRVAGTSGVNRYNGAVESSADGSFAIDRPVSTMMAGPEDAMKAEASYLRRLEEATSYAIDGDTLVLTDADGQPSLTFTRA
ncbi:hypothetical protein MLP_32170 [Microlunatus phosphovorus NM-1]|uniref:DUF306 domain-containing protein n=1 Tax=Microlunatus phosphovorus (strain ATCC 700054 / DSM 10555 / JCM 9379 / NBRC 101784 / NCIMB 13414 / VKM Ac-1990 / NM-1) TaxID=1032480 RepID=F5XLG5_MICPN|nr:META domain-containing protein [Microlunatus phosphovorus]BAK36231.1 hypothetical protein MLP_32170 [Microlunatus phosphovorus NM-1]